MKKTGEVGTQERREIQLAVYYSEGFKGVGWPYSRRRMRPFSEDGSAGEKRNRWLPSTSLLT